MFLQVTDAKPLIKEALQAAVGLPVDRDVPVIGFIGRLEEQKGSDILVEALSKFMGLNVQMVILVSTQSSGLVIITSLRSQTFFFGFNVKNDHKLIDSCLMFSQGTGKKKMEAQILELEEKFPGKAVGVAKFNVPLAHMITAGADFIIVPSRFEPCGLIQLHAMRYGTVPIVASTGGLVDTVKDGYTGFHIGRFNVKVTQNHQLSCFFYNSFLST